MYLNMFPTSVEDFTDDYFKLIQMCEMLPNRIVCEIVLFLKTFERAYGSNLWDHSNLINLKLLDVL